MSDDKPVLGYWKIRGLASQIRYQLAYLGIEYEMVEYEQGDAPDFSRDSWLNDKYHLGLDFPNLPYFTHGDVKITETSAIHKYIAGMWGPELLGRDPSERAHVNMVASIVGDLKGATTMGCYVDGDKAQICKIIFDKVPAIVRYLGYKKFLCSDDQVTWVDFFFAELCDFMQFLTEGSLYKNYPVLHQYFETVMGLPGLQQYWRSEYCMKAPFNNKIAKINN